MVKLWESTWKRLVGSYLAAAEPRVLLFAHDARWQVSKDVAEFIEEAPVPTLLVKPAWLCY